MLFVWIILGIGVYLLLAIAVGRFLSVNRLSRIRDGIFEEALPSAVTGARGDAARQPGMSWTEAENLTALDHERTPAEKRALIRVETEETVHSG